MISRIRLRQRRLLARNSGPLLRLIRPTTPTTADGKRLALLAFRKGLYFGPEIREIPGLLRRNCARSKKKIVRGAKPLVRQQPHCPGATSVLEPFLHDEHVLHRHADTVADKSYGLVARTETSSHASSSASMRLTSYSSIDLIQRARRRDARGIPHTGTSA